MTEVSAHSFGYLIAFVIPGFVVVGTFSAYSPTLRAWLSVPPVAAPTIGGFLYVTLASVAAGMTVSALRWLLLDTIHHHTGLPRPAWDFSTLQANLPAFKAIAEHHYRHYQHFGNSLIALLVALASPQALISLFPVRPEAAFIGASTLVVLYFVASRDALRKYYARGSALLGVTYPLSSRSRAMTNGFRHNPKTENQHQRAELSSQEHQTSVPSPSQQQEILDNDDQPHNQSEPSQRDED